MAHRGCPVPLVGNLARLSQQPHHDTRHKQQSGCYGAEQCAAESRAERTHAERTEWRACSQQQSSDAATVSPEQSIVDIPIERSGRRKSEQKHAGGPVSSGGVQDGNTAEERSG